jgi:hypothetical protein
VGRRARNASPPGRAPAARAGRADRIAGPERQRGVLLMALPGMIGGSDDRRRSGAATRLDGSRIERIGKSHGASLLGAIIVVRLSCQVIENCCYVQEYFKVNGKSKLMYLSIVYWLSTSTTSIRAPISLRLGPEPAPTPARRGEASRPRRGPSQLARGQALYRRRAIRFSRRNPAEEKNCASDTRVVWPELSGCSSLCK